MTITLLTDGGTQLELAPGTQIDVPGGIASLSSDGRVFRVRQPDAGPVAKPSAAAFDGSNWGWSWRPANDGTALVTFTAKKVVP